MKYRTYPNIFTYKSKASKKYRSIVNEKSLNDIKHGRWVPRKVIRK